MTSWTFLLLARRPLLGLWRPLGGSSRGAFLPGRASVRGGAVAPSGAFLSWGRAVVPGPGGGPTAAGTAIPFGMLIHPRLRPRRLVRSLVVGTLLAFVAADTATRVLTLWFATEKLLGHGDNYIRARPAVPRERNQQRQSRRAHRKEPEHVSERMEKKNLVREPDLMRVWRKKII